MQATQLHIGSYGVQPGPALSSYEDECVGSSPLALQGIVVTRIEGDKVLVSDWHITSHFEGQQTLEQFEEAKHNQRPCRLYAGRASVRLKCPGESAWWCRRQSMP